jgi:hypothetical protein
MDWKTKCMLYDILGIESYLMLVKYSKNDIDCLSVRKEKDFVSVCKKFFDKYSFMYWSIRGFKITDAEE